MVNLYVFNPAEKLRFLSRVLFRGSKRLLRSVNSAPTVPVKSHKVNLSCLASVDPCTTPSSGGLVRDSEYYKDASEGGFCIFRVENTLFKVHRCFLLREPSAFGSLFSLPPSCSHGGNSDDTAVPLSDSVEHFRDLLWVLHALPTELCPAQNSLSSVSLDRLMNIAEVTNKYCFASYEMWAIERIYSLVQDPTGPLASASPALFARILNIAGLCNHTPLLDFVTDRLVPRMLWSSMPLEVVTEVAERHGIRRLLGISYYRQLVAIEQGPCGDRITSCPIFPPTFNIEKRMRFLAAHHSLLKLWESLRTKPLPFHSNGCSSHADCLATWEKLWFDAGMSNESFLADSADVLGRLKIMMLYLRNAVTVSPWMSLQCTLAALEAITMARDEIIDELLNFFDPF